MTTKYSITYLGTIPATDEHILLREDPENWNFSDLDDLWQDAITATTPTCIPTSALAV